MTTKTATTAKPKQKDPKFRVHPKLSIRAIDLRSRIKNRSIILNEQDQHTMDVTMHEAMSLSKPEIIDRAIRNDERIKDLQKQLQQAESNKNKSLQEQIKKDLQELEQLRNEKKQPKP